MLPKTHWQQFGAWIRKMRRDAELTQKQVADRSGIHEVQLARIEKGESGTKRDTVIALAKAIGIDEEIALNNAGYATVNSDNKSGLIIPAYPKRPKNIAEFLEALGAIGEFNFAIDPAELDKYTEDDFQELLERIKADVEITVRRKRR
jgi:transcriptional regulator with XRE-family HTH domain